MPKYKAVIFDFDDTLVESRAIKWAHHKHVAKKFYNVDITDEILNEHWGKPFPVLLKALYGDVDTVENMVKANAHTRDDFLKKVYPGSVEVVTKLLGQGVEIGLLSAAHKEFIILDLERLGFPKERFILIQDAQDTTVHKPDPRVFDPMLVILKERGIKKEEIIYVGDSMMDFEAARDAHLHFLAVTTGLYSRKDFERAGANMIVGNITQALDFLL